MAIGVHFTPPSMTAEQYDEVIRRLEEAGAGNPDGRLIGTCYGSGSSLVVSDVWESREHPDRFVGETLTPILEHVQLDPGTPAIHELHNLIEGARLGAASEPPLGGLRAQLGRAGLLARAAVAVQRAALDRVVDRR